MDERDDYPKYSFEDLPSASFSDLKGKQSVRATFKLSPKAIETISIVAVQLGIKQKSLFDHLMEDINTLKAIADNISSRQFKQIDRVQKTYVLSRKTLSSLEHACRTFDASRDALVEYSIKRLLPIIAQERKRHERRKAIVTTMESHLTQNEVLLAKAYELLGGDDPIYKNLNMAVSAFKQAVISSNEFVEKGKSIEKF
ncbi:MAG: hypothetical protein PVI90_04640 [Desulfobacteraceae bacterium]|jgi:hypothetical protein